MKVYTISELKQLMEPICKEFNIPRMYLFGSYATGQADGDSDVDIVIDSQYLHGLLDLFRVREALVQTLGKSVDLLTIGAMKDEEKNPIKQDFLRNYEKEKVCLYER